MMVWMMMKIIKILIHTIGASACLETLGTTITLLALILNSAKSFSIFCDSILASMVLLNISNMLMLLFSLSLPVVNTLNVHSENCCLGDDSDDDYD